MDVRFAVEPMTRVAPSQCLLLEALQWEGRVGFRRRWMLLAEGASQTLLKRPIAFLYCQTDWAALPTLPLGND